MIGPLVAVLVVAEIVAFVAVAHATSWSVAVLLVVGLSIVGGTVARRIAVGAFRRMRDARRVGAVTDVALADSAVALAGSVLLVVPGFVTDVIGLVMVVPWTRRLVRVAVGRRLAARMPLRRAWARAERRPPRQPPPDGGHEVIEGRLDDGPDSTTPR